MNKTATSPQLFLLTNGKSAQIDLLNAIASEYGIKSLIIDIQDFNDTITMDKTGIFINLQKIKAPAVFYQLGLNADYITVPELTGYRKNWSYFQDSQPVMEQLNSQALSLLSYASEQILMISVNNPVETYNFKSRLFLYKTLSALGLNVPDYILTNRLSSLKKSNVYGELPEILWSYPDSDSPIKSLKKVNLHKLLTETNDLPFIFMSSVTGMEVRVWFYNRIPLLAASVGQPVYEIDSSEMLEKFKYHKPGKSLFDLGEKLYTVFHGFYEIRGVIGENDELTIYNIDFNPDFMYLGPVGQKYLATELLASAFRILVINIPNEIDLPESESRVSMFSGRMLEALFAAEEAN